MIFCLYECSLDVSKYPNFTSLFLDTPPHLAPQRGGYISWGLQEQWIFRVTSLQLPSNIFSIEIFPLKSNCQNLSLYSFPHPSANKKKLENFEESCVKRILWLVSEMSEAKNDWQTRAWFFSFQTNTVVIQWLDMFYRFPSDYHHLNGPKTHLMVFDWSNSAR